jgi:hypothetical protein
MPHHEETEYEKLKRKQDIDNMYKQRGIWAKRGVYVSIAMIIIIFIFAAISMLTEKK